MFSSGGGIGAFNDAISVGSAATRHWVNSVSDIYGPDEIEELLDDLNRLEIAGAAYSQDGDQEAQLPDYQGLQQSQTIMVGTRQQREENIREQRKRYINEHEEKEHDQGILFDNGIELRQRNMEGHVGETLEEDGDERYRMSMQTRGSPTLTVRSWDSHTHYQEFKEPEDDDPDIFYPSRPMQSIVCYCDTSTFKTPRTLLRVLLVVSH